MTQSRAPGAGAGRGGAAKVVGGALTPPAARVREGARQGERDDVRARRHPLARARLAELDDGLNELALFALDYPFVLADIYERLYVAEDEGIIEGEERA